MKRLIALSCVALFAASPAANADVKLPSIFSDHMVLQQDLPAAVWGWAEKGEEVTVTVDKASATTKAGDNGKWSVKLEKLPTGGPFTMTVKGKNTLTVSDVLVGEVWLCSGQSNMAFTVARSDNFEKEKPLATNPLIRMYTVGRNPQRTQQEDAPGKWVLTSPEAVGNFSAAAYFFGREIFPTIKRPIGLINSSYGGTDIAAWTSEEALTPVPELKAQLETWQKNDKAYDADKAKARYEAQVLKYRETVKVAKEAGKQAPRAPQKPVQPSLSQNHPANLFNGMIAPVMPYTVRGALWYQGEHNSGSTEAGLLYRKQMPLLIQDWRTRWGYDFPVGIVQLPNFIKPGEGWQLVREAMLMTAETVPNVGLAITTDIGNPKDVHPTNKQDVGKRLAMWALATVYGQKEVAASGPRPASHAMNGNSVTVKFKHTNGGLVAKGGELKGFTIAGEDGKFFPATAKIEGDTIVITSPQVTKATAARYAWQDNPDCNLYNGAGIPATPFRTDAK